MRVGKLNNFMAITILTVTVFGGVPPEGIDVSLFKGAERILKEHKTESFNLSIEGLESGFVYSLFIAGRNPLTIAGGATKCELTLDEISLHPPDDSPVFKTGKQYLAQFHFTV